MDSYVAHRILPLLGGLVLGVAVVVVLLAKGC